MGRGPSQFRRPRRATEPLVSGLEGLDVDPDLRVGRVPASNFGEALEEINRNVLARVFWEDRAFISSTSIRGIFCLRLCILNHTTTWVDVRETLEVTERFGAEALSKLA